MIWCIRSPNPHPHPNPNPNPNPNPSPNPNPNPNPNPSPSFNPNPEQVAQLRRARVNGYAPRLAALPAHVARGRSVQWQRTVLAQHCEKKALAAQLALDYPAPTLRTTHRMCIDCHDAFLAASLAYNRTITCQDPGHLHVFKRGKCSCGGRWRGQPARAAPGPAAEERYSR